MSQRVTYMKLISFLGRPAHAVAMYSHRHVRIIATTSLLVRALRILGVSDVPDVVPQAIAQPWQNV